MKMRGTLMVIAAGIAGFAFQTMAAPPTSVTSVTNTPPVVASQPQLTTQNAPPGGPSASTVTPKKKVYWFTTAPSKAPSEVHWYGQDSSRPWAEICGWHPGQTQFADGHNNEPQLVLLQVEWGR